jgi:hypothetical protein
MSGTGSAGASGPVIGELNEGSLHAALKQHYARPGDALEVPLGGFVIDIVRGLGTPDEQLIEIQTGSFGAMGRKLDHLLDGRRMLIVHPIAVRTVLERDGRRRTSPVKGRLHDVLDELVSLPTMLDHPALTLEVVLVETTAVQAPVPGRRRGRAAWRTVDRRLDRMLSVHRFGGMDDLRALAPGPLPDGFGTDDLALAAAVDRDTARKLAYCLSAAGVIEEIARTRQGKRYRWAAPG